MEAVAKEEKEKMHEKKVLILVILMVTAIFIYGCGGPGQETAKQTIKIGILPIEDTLPLIVAQEKGYFAEENLDLQLIPFQSAVERDSALQAKEVDGMITDLVASILLKNSGTDLRIVSLTLGADASEGRFAVLAAPQSGIETIDDLKNKEIAISANSIIEYVTDQLLLGHGFLPNEIKKNVIPKIPVRLNMLLEGQVPAATLPDPLATFAEFKGAKLIIDDTGDNVSQVVLVFRQEVLSEKEAALKRMFAAYNRAVHDINNDPESFRSLLVEKARVPEPIKDTYRVAQFPYVQVPTKQQVERVLQWLRDKNLITEELTYQQLVDDEFVGQ